MNNPKSVATRKTAASKEDESEIISKNIRVNLSRRHWRWLKKQRHQNHAVRKAIEYYIKLNEEDDDIELED